MALAQRPRQPLQVPQQWVWFLSLEAVRAVRIEIVATDHEAGVISIRERNLLVGGKVFCIPDHAVRGRAVLQHFLHRGPIHINPGAVTMPAHLHVSEFPVSQGTAGERIGAVHGDALRLMRGQRIAVIERAVMLARI